MAQGLGLDSGKVKGLMSYIPLLSVPWARESVLSQAEGGGPVPRTEQQPFVRGLGLLCRVLGPTL